MLIKYKCRGSINKFKEHYKFYLDNKSRTVNQFSRSRYVSTIYKTVILPTIITCRTKEENISTDYPTNVCVSLLKVDFLWKQYFSVFKCVF